ncbi:ABC transporter permease [Candidatus Desantisbacteria bacterium]|nr:ABC transporter permease [Candidatus Desantisbacteria bacterium]
MREFIIKRLLRMIPILFGITFISFFVIQLAPGDYFTSLSMNPQISPATLEKMRIQFGLNKPWIVQYFKWVWNLIHLNFGESFIYHVPVITLIKQRLFNTFILSTTAIIFSWLIAIPLGIYCAVKQYSWIDKFFSAFSIIGISSPGFYMAFLLLFFAAKTGIFPIGGVISIDHESLSTWRKIMDYARHMAIPSIVLIFGSIAGLLRIMRANMLDILHAPYITTARAKGQREFFVIFKHGLRNAVNPLITIFGYTIPEFLGGAALIEMVTAWPGLGRLMLDAVRSHDQYLVMGDLVISGVLLLMGNLIADILHMLVDPRRRESI